MHPADLKAAVEVQINRLLAPIIKEFETPDLKKLAEKAYPQPGKQSIVVYNSDLVLSMDDLFFFYIEQVANNVSDEIHPSRLDIRVGQIVEVSRHPDADALYVEKIDLG